jgi:hypothetical protein
VFAWKVFSLIAGGSVVAAFFPPSLASHLRLHSFGTHFSAPPPPRVSFFKKIHNLLNALLTFYLLVCRGGLFYALFRRGRSRKKISLAGAVRLDAFFLSPLRFDGNFYFV